MYRIILLSFWLLTQSALIYAQGKGKRNNNKKSQQPQQQNKKSDDNRIDISISDGNLILGVPNETSIMASVVLQSGSEYFIEYAEHQESFNRRTATHVTKDNDPNEIELKNLKPNTSYHYRLGYKLPGEKDFALSPESWFSTKKKNNSTFSFGVQGDSHPERLGKMFSPELYLNTLDSVAAHKPDFYFMMGDDFNIDRYIGDPLYNKKAIEATYQRQRNFLGKIGSNPPLFLVNGNHEQTARYLLNGTPNSAPVIAANARKKYFPLPVPNGIYTGNKDTVQFIGTLSNYYAFEWGNALFIVIDPYWHSDIAVDNQPMAPDKEGKKNLWQITIGNEQYQWLKKTLENSKAKFKFVFAHHVMGTGRGGIERASFYEWGGKSPNGTDNFKKFRPGWDLPIHQLMAKNKVTIFFQGHDHLYAKQELDGVIYQSVPNPADDSHTAFNKEAYTSGKILPNSGFLNVTVGVKEVKVEYVRSFMANAGKIPEIRDNYTYWIR